MPYDYFPKIAAAPSDLSDFVEQAAQINQYQRALTVSLHKGNAKGALFACEEIIASLADILMTLGIDENAIGALMNRIEAAKHTL